MTSSESFFATPPMAAPVAPTPPAGWHPDPQQPALLRWYDGHQWTATTRPMPPPAYGFGMPPATPAGAHPQDPVHWLLPVGRSWQSIVAGYLGLFSVLLLPAPFALGFGIWALAESRRTGTHGRGRAIFGIVAGALGSLLLLVAVVNGSR